MFPELTVREHEVLDLIAAGRSNTDVADTLVLSPRRCGTTVSAISFKLDVAGRAEAIVRRATPAAAADAVPEPPADSPVAATTQGPSRR